MFISYGLFKKRFDRKECADVDKRNDTNENFSEKWTGGILLGQQDVSRADHAAWTQMTTDVTA